MDECSPYSTSSPAKAIIGVFDFSHSDRFKMVCQSCFGLHFLIAKEVEHDLKCLLAIRSSSVANSCREPPGCRLGQIVPAVLQPGGIHIL